MKISKKLKILYENAIRNIDGPWGNRLRYRYYKKRFKYLGDDVIIDTGVFFTNENYISIDDNSHIDKGCIIVASPENINISQRALKETKNPRIDVRKGELTIGKDCHIAQNCMIFAYGGVKIGNNCVMSTGAKIYSLTSLPKNPDDSSQICSIVPYEGISPTEIGPVELEDNCWLAINVLVFPGVKLGENSFVRTNSIVSKSFEKNSYISGDPAKYIKPRFKIEKICQK